MQEKIEKIARAIRTVPDFPKEGIQFKDITPLLAEAELFAETIECFRETISDKSIQVVAGIESRGFIFGAALALQLGVGFIPIRKPGKLPYKTFRQEYALEYGTDALEIHQDAVENGQKVLLIDDLLATGGTALAAAKLIEQCGGEVVAIRFLIELDFLKGRDRLKAYDVQTLIHF